MPLSAHLQFAQTNRTKPKLQKSRQANAPRQTKWTGIKYIDKKGEQLTVHWQYGGAKNIFSAFCSLPSFGFGRRIKPSNRINNELLYF